MFAMEMYDIVIVLDTAGDEKLDKHPVAKRCMNAHHKYTSKMELVMRVYRLLCSFLLTSPFSSSLILLRFTTSTIASSKCMHKGVRVQSSTSTL